MKKWRVKSFDEATRVIQYLNVFLGLRVLEHPRGHLRPYLTALYILMMTAVFVFSVEANSRVVVNVNYLKFQGLIYKSIFIVTTLSLIALCGLGFFKTRAFLRYKRRTEEIEEKLQALGGSINKAILLKHSLICLAIWFAFLALVIHLYLMWLVIKSSTHSIIGFVAGYTYGETAATVVLLDFAISVDWLKEAFKEMNRLLGKGFQGGQHENVEVAKDSSTLDLDNLQMARREERILYEFLARSSKNPISKNRKESDSSRAIKVLPRISDERLWLWKIREVHLSLYRSAKLMFDIYRLQVVMEMGLYIVFFTAKLYYIYIDYTQWDQTSASFEKLVVPAIVDCTMICAKLFVCCSICEYTFREMKQTSEIIYSLPEVNNNPEFTDEVHQFALQTTLAHQGVVTYNFSQLGYNFIRAFLSTTSTYLVIMIQVGDSLDSQNAVQNSTNV